MRATIVLATWIAVAGFVPREAVPANALTILFLVLLGMDMVELVLRGVLWLRYGERRRGRRPGE